VTNTFYLDSDTDGFGDAASPTQTDCQPDTNVWHFNGDLYVSDATDCNDGSAAINPGASEVCDGLDNDCNGSADDGLLVTSYYRDFDNDSFGDPDRTRTTCDGPDNGYIVDNTDCDDHDNSINPAADEIPDDEIDNNCDGRIDCDDPSVANDPVCGGQEPEICDDGIDNDGDGKIDCADNQCQNDPYCQASVDCGDIDEKKACNDAGCTWNKGQGSCQ
jgi:hypothetical protein